MPTAILRVLSGLGLATAVLTGATPALAWPAETRQELAVREGPGMDYPFIEVIPPGSSVEVYHCVEGRSWCKIDANGVVGFVRRDSLYRVEAYNPGPPPPRVYIAPLLPPPVVIYPGPPRYYSRPYHRRYHY